MPRNRPLPFNLQRLPDADNPRCRPGIDIACPAGITATKTRAL